MTDQNNFRKFFDRIPDWVPSVVVALAVLWLTLAPHPLGDDQPTLFPGADKLVHALMFGGLTFVIIFDHYRKHHWQPSSLPMIAAVTLGCILFGALIEVLQLEMKLGRSFDFIDIVADAFGCILAAIFWIIFHLTHTKPLN